MGTTNTIKKLAGGSGMRNIVCMLMKSLLIWITMWMFRVCLMSVLVFGMIAGIFCCIPPM